MRLNNQFNLDYPTCESILKAIREGNKVKAVQIVVKASGRGLKESKDYVDQLWAEVHRI
jgi:ribosomal protein L7/L12